MTEIKVGARLRSAVCSTEVMVVAAPDRPVELTCGGVPMIDMDGTPPAGVELSGEAAAGSLMGKRYTNDAADIEVLCTKPGDGSLGLDGEILEVKEAKTLPSSD
ncbi:MAG: hypothetical protein IT198_08600 [Acidimicrobiia bacterium]|nr:hypothetical protein [Acidimicrobiia bacterium]